MIEKPTNLDDRFYFAPLIERVPGNNLFETLENVKSETLQLMKSVPMDKVDFAYAPDKWTVKEVFQHLNDVERILCYRALSIARKETGALPGFDENEYAANCYSESLDYREVVFDYGVQRNSTISLFNSFHPEAMMFEGNANGMMITPQILGWFIAGHNYHHNEVIRTRYLQ